MCMSVCVRARRADECGDVVCRKERRTEGGVEECGETERRGGVCGRCLTLSVYPRNVGSGETRISLLLKGRCGCRCR